MSAIAKLRVKHDVIQAIGVWSLASQLQKKFFLAKRQCADCTHAHEGSLLVSGVLWRLFPSVSAIFCFLAFGLANDFSDTESMPAQMVKENEHIIMF